MDLGSRVTGLLTVPIGHRACACQSLRLSSVAPQRSLIRAAACFSKAHVEQSTEEVVEIIPQTGGSICNDLFADLLGIPAIWIPHSYAGCAQHAPDEHILMPISRNALEIMAGLYWDLGDEKAGAP